MRVAHHWPQLLLPRRPHAAAAPRARQSAPGGATLRWNATAQQQAAPAALTPRSVAYSQWYHDVVAAADLVDQSPVKGCAILKPRGYAIWECIQRELDARIRARGHSNVYFPLLVPASLLSREDTHVGGFAKECAVVTHHRLRKREDGTPGVEVDPTASLAEPLVIRPTSEAVVWDALGRWIRTHRDLPMLLNQWANVVRWEMRTRPFLRTSEFLWQEGHTAHATEAEAAAHALAMQGMYAEFLETVLAIPCVRGAKSVAERFAGAVETLTCEAVMQNGWALQIATSHFLGQNFSRAFDVRFTSADGARRDHVWSTSWGASTRLIGGAILSHSDDVGLVLPPGVAPTQVVIVPIAGGGGGAKSGGARAVAAAPPAASSAATSAAGAEAASSVMIAAESVARALSAAGFRVIIDRETADSPGKRFYAWERRGVPLRLEIGPRDIAAGVLVARNRIGGPRTSLPLDPATLPAAVGAMLEGVHALLLSRARERLSSCAHEISSYSELVEMAAQSSSSAAISDSSAAMAAEGESEGTHGAASPVFFAPWHEDAQNEAKVKAETRFTLRCYPQDRNHGAEAVAGRKCFLSGRPATHIAMFARAY